MHYHAEVWLDKVPVNLTAALTRIMAPYEERSADGELRGWWDWWQVGGRYTGRHTGYDPRTDPRNVKNCEQCNGTGFRNDSLGRAARLEDPTYTCNGCGEHHDGKWTHGSHGPGRHVKWPTDFAEYDGDIFPVVAIKDTLTAYTLIVGDTVAHMEIWDGKNWVSSLLKDQTIKKTLADLGVKDGYLVTVDYHC
jgi:hypothetical protein